MSPPPAAPATPYAAVADAAPDLAAQRAADDERQWETNMVRACVRVGQRVTC